MALDRTWYNTLVDDDGSGTTGSVWDKADVDSLMDAIDTEIARIDANGVTSTGTKVTQIAFEATQVPSADANTLDDYEEGSWTPVIGGSGGTTGQTYSIQVGRYIKIGKMVQCQAYAVLSAKGTITGNVEIQGIPFASENIANMYAVTPVFWAGLSTNWVSIVGYLIANTQTVRLVGTTAAAGANSTNLLTADISNTGTFMISFCYRAAA